MEERLLIATLGLLSLAVVVEYLSVNPVWVTVMLSAGIAYGSLAPVIAARKLYFLAGAAPHAAFLAAVAGIALSGVLGLDRSFAALLVGLALLYSIGLAIHRGRDPDIATSVFVAFTASTTVIAVYFVLSAYPLETDIATIVVGDPLLATRKEALISAILGALCLAASGLTYCEQACIGIDPDTARLSGARIWVYDIILFTLLALVSVALVRIVGFVLEHVLVLLPASIAVTGAWSARSAFLVSLISGVSASILGLSLALILNQAPSGITGLTLLAVYIALLIASKR